MNTAPSHINSTLHDQFLREKHKLRISLTDRCNFRCQYCMPEQPQWMAKQNMLSFDELDQLCQLMLKMGIQHIRLTGGEPLLRLGVVEFVARLNQLRTQGLERISMTSNAYYLARHAQALKDAGLDDINISLDSIDPARFFSMTQRRLAPVLQGIQAAQQVSLPIKINCVLMAGHNDQDILPLTHWAMQQGLQLRFIEYMPLDQSDHWQADQVITEQQILATLANYFAIEAIPRGHDPASLYRLDGHYNLGIISTISHPFCQSCDRLRITANGDLYTCLFSEHGTPLRPLLAQGDLRQLEQLIRHAVWHKSAGYIAAPQRPRRKISMHNIGG